MPEIQENLVRSNKRIVAVSKWRNPASKTHLQSIYYNNDVGYDTGYRNFFSENLDVMSVAQAQKHLNWKVAANNGYSTLCVNPNSDFYFSVGNSRKEREIVFRDAARQSITQIIAETKLPLNWVAAVNASCCFMVGMIVVSKTIFDSETSQFRVIKNCFPDSFFQHDESAVENTNFIEKTIAKAFFDRAAHSEDFENRIDGLIEISRKYNFELPLSYYAFRYIDGRGNLITEHERRLSRYE